MMRKKVELLAPAGGPESFYGAVRAGADAVYLGGSRFGARAYAENFTEAELVNCIRMAHVLGRRVYLTVNTLVKEKEFPELFSYLRPYYEAGLDGFIVQDIGVVSTLRKHFPEVELHASTQMNITGPGGASFLKELGICRVVPARELSLEELRSMKEESGLEIETFIHGAMCYCYSGQCLFSSILGGRSGNRGRCAQPCRLPYRVRTQDGVSEEGYPLSLKDMCTIEHIPELVEAGIDSFKIEGRMKKPEYAAGVTAVYRKYIDLYDSLVREGKQECYQVEPEDLKLLGSLYIRSGRQEGYYHRHNGADMVTLDSPAYGGSDEAFLADIRRKYLDARPSLPVTMRAVFATGQPARLTAACPAPRRMEGCEEYLAEAGEMSMIVQREAGQKGRKRIDENEDMSVTVQGELVQQAENRPISIQNVEKQIKKLGNTLFELQKADIEIGEHAFYPLKEINELRRRAVAALEDKLIAENGLCIRRSVKSDGLTGSAGVVNTAGQAENSGAMGGDGINIVLNSLPQLRALVNILQGPGSPSLNKVYMDCDFLMSLPAGEAFRELFLLMSKAKLFLALPYILRKRDKAYLLSVSKLLESQMLSGCMARSYEGYAYLQETGYKGLVALDAGIYIWNHEALRFWQDRADSFCLPLELNAGEQRALLSGLNGEMCVEKIVYGRIPMMITANCVIRTMGHCRQEENGVLRTVLHDRYGKDFPVLANCAHCMNIIYNSVPLSLHGSLQKWNGKAAFRLDFTTEDEKETAQALRFFAAALRGGAQTPDWEYTTGHEKRGVE